MEWVQIIISSLLGLAIGGIVGFLLRVRIVEKSFLATRTKAQKIVEEATTQAEKIKKRETYRSQTRDFQPLSGKRQTDQGEKSQRSGTRKQTESTRRPA